MSLVISKEKVPNFEPDHFLRRAGWAYIFDRKREQGSYVKRLTRDFYPRLHLYVKEKPDCYALQIHLDQKRASYEGVRMHNAEYEGPVVENAYNELIQSLKSYLA